MHKITCLELLEILIAVLEQKKRDFKMTYDKKLLSQSEKVD